MPGKGRPSKRKRFLKHLTAVVFTAVALSAAYVLWLPDVKPLKRSNPIKTSMIRLREIQAQRAGKKFTPRMTWASWDQISDHLKHAVLIAEDDMFYRHDGVDWEAVRAALGRDWEEKTLRYGGSTITQQVAKNLYLSPSRNPLRKIKELLIARRLERDLGKRRIFELYLNIAEWGKGIFGAEAAAQTYFAKSALDLDPEESAALAAVLPNPRRWNPASDSRYVSRNSRRILGRMRASGFLPEEQVELELSPEEEPPPLFILEPDPLELSAEPISTETLTGQEAAGTPAAATP